MVPLVPAAMCGHEACVGEVLPAKSSVRASDTEGYIALAKAEANGHVR